MRLFAGTPFDRPPRCAVCGELEEACLCPPQPPVRLPPETQTARVVVERRKHGKRVTVVRGLPAEGNDLPALLSLLQSHCGAGGTLHGEDLEIQGEQLDRVRQKLIQLGYRVRGT